MLLSPKTVFQDDKILLVNKPSGWVVNRAKTTRKQLTIQDWLEKKFRLPIFAFRAYRSGLVHRLDKETSGLLLVAKTKTAFENLQKQFKERQVEKKYLALVHGRVEPKKGLIEAKISRSPFNRQKFGVFLGGRSAQTEYQVKKYYGLKPRTYTFLELMPKTGRTHQIRVHLKYIGHPVVGDEKYAGRKTSRADRQWCPRQFLHASFLSFKHPQTGKKVKFSLPLADDLKRALEDL